MRSTAALDAALKRRYRFNVLADVDGGYVIQFPDLPGCMTQVEDIAEVGAAAEEIRTLWIETAFELGQPIPAPTFLEEFSGKFNVRIPKSLHRDLVHLAAEEGVSLNQLVVSLLSDRSVWRDRDAPGSAVNQPSDHPRFVKIG
jgi:antitoxin HicB